MNDGEPDDADGEGSAELTPGTELLASRLPPSPPSDCPVCGAPRPTEGRYCERCGFDLAAAAPAAAERWIAEVVADRELYDRVAPDGLEFPEGRDAITLAVAGSELLIGRRHEARGIEPAIDLSGSLADPAASHQHAVLTRLDDGDYTVTDVGSTNGTELNGGQVTLEPGQAHRLGDGDRIHVGAWTTITVRRLTS